MGRKRCGIILAQKQRGGELSWQARARASLCVGKLDRLLRSLLQPPTPSCCITDTPVPHPRFLSSPRSLRRV